MSAWVYALGLLTCSHIDNYIRLTEFLENSLSKLTVVLVFTILVVCPKRPIWLSKSPKWLPTVKQQLCDEVAKK